jgi:hypothetical protein
MKLENLKPEMSTLTKIDNLNYNLDFGDIKHKSDPDLKLKFETDSEDIKVKTSCGGCTKAWVKDNMIFINYNTSLLGRILKHVYIFEGENKIDIKLTGKIK